jgi:hypothetical protein
MSNFLKALLKDKGGCYSLREVVTLVFVLIIIASWIGQQFFSIEVPEYMFYSFVSLVGAGCFGYSIERKVRPNQRFNNDDNK